MSNLTYAIIPARSGSKGIKSKNIRLLGGYPLIAYSIAAAKLVPGISKVIVSTDSEEYAEIAIKFGAEVPILRPAELSADLSPDKDLFIHLLEHLKSEKSKIPDLMVHLRPTTPLRDPLIINQAIEIFKKNIHFSSLRSAHQCSESPFKWFMISEDKRFTTLSGERSLDNVNNARQVFPNVYIPNGYVDIIKTSLLVEKKLLHGDNVFPFITESVVEIDTLEDFEYLDYKISKVCSPLTTYLKKCN